MKIGFLFNHDALHQVRHTAPVIAELAGEPGVAVSVLTSSPAQEAEVGALLGEAAARVRFVALSIGAAARVLDAGLRWIAPFRRIAMLRENLPVFAALDVLVVPETTSLMLRDRFGLDRLKFVWIPHGAGDRSIGFRAVARGFDLTLLSGVKVRDRMLANGVITPTNHAIVGYPKFDTIAFDADPPRLFADDRPTVLYNPHFDPALSSWYDWGRAIIDWFAAQGRFNLVVAPHVMLFQRRWHASVEHRRVRTPGRVPAARPAPNILVDPGSERSVDMSYTRAADIYLGDASSQIYEWIVRPRPAIFLNPSQTSWTADVNFAHWQLGEVIDRLEQLPDALDRAATTADAFRLRQEQALAATFSTTGDTAAHRAAQAILTRFQA